MDARPKIEVVRVSSVERGKFAPLAGVQLHAAYSHIRIGTYCPEPKPVSKTMFCENKPPMIEQARKNKKNFGPVSRLLRRRPNSSCLATKSCDNIYNVNRSNSLDWRNGQNVNQQGLQPRQSSSLDWRVGRTVNLGSSRLEWRDTTRSAEQLSRSVPNALATLQTPSTKSKLVSLLKRLSPRLPRPASKGSLPSPPVVCPWVQVEYSTESVNNAKRGESQESDASFQHELRLNELKKRMAGQCAASTSQVFTSVARDEKSKRLSHPSIRIEDSDPDYNPYIYRAVHEERGAQRSAPVHSEVAGLENSIAREGDTVPVVPGGGCTGKLRLRPLSLAVQPLHYQQLSTESADKCLKMTSQESIGSCSLDVDTSASDRSETTIGSVSERTLHSLNISCNGEPVPSSELLPNGSNETIQQRHLDANKENIINGQHESLESEQLTAKKPSYLGLACSISGYSGITRYDSKLREGFRSRDSSPGNRLITRDTSPAGFRSSENLSLPPHPHPSKSQSISPLAMERQNGFVNGLKDECKVESFVETRSSVSVCQGFSEVDNALPLHTTFPDISPIRGTPDLSPIKRSPGMIRFAAYSQHSKSFTSSTTESSPKSTTINVSNASFTETSMTNGSNLETGNQTFNSSSSSEKSFIQQRVERLYGPGALAQGFFFKRSNTKLNSSDSFNRSYNNNNNNNNNNKDHSPDNVNEEESLKSLPVLRHLRPEFRAQLPVVSPRKPTDGTEQIIKPLQRVSLTSSRKAEQEGQVPVTIDISGCGPDKESHLCLSASITSIPDQQPAAPAVVLPVLEPSASSTSIAKQAAEAEKAVEVKDGLYFMKLLKAEMVRLLALAASAEAELASGDPAALPEEAAGRLRSAAGKARLLATQKMQQFEGLCQKNINQIPGEEFPTTNEDLAGFWDMVMLQVVQVNELFDQIKRLKESHWQEVIPDELAITSTPQNGAARLPKRRVAVAKAKPTANSEVNRKAREARELARRQMIEERRRAVRAQAQNGESSVKIFAPET